MSVTSLVCLFRAVLRPQLSILERSLKGALEQDIRTMRRFHFPDLSEGLTEDQKADIHRRFDELQTYTLTPTNFPFGRKGEIDFSNLPVIDCPPVPRREMRSGHF